MKFSFPRPATWGRRRRERPETVSLQLTKCARRGNDDDDLRGGAAHPGKKNLRTGDYSDARRSASRFARAVPENGVPRDENATATHGTRDSSAGADGAALRARVTQRHLAEVQWAL